MVVDSLQLQKPSLRFNAVWVIGDVAARCIAMDSEMKRSRTMESDEESHPESAESKERGT
ncbi:hypothetical protein N7494_005827 [Penicillium frequentans]|uniref:Uncharacterized protein n=1 Tax=Penicillium frequentans TaxID=3151616 RepID=A0AAD6GFX9_9EURO|nr:hypothetical protein N7494_005827 [Penicillium glabrum]